MRRWMLFAVVVAIIVLMVGCGGGGGGSSTPGVSLSIGADTLYSETRSATRSGSALTAPLEAGAIVHVINFQTGQEIKTSTIGADGWCSLEGIPSGLSLVIVVNGTRNEKNYRLSLLIPCVSSNKTEYVVDPASSIAAEAFCGDATHRNYANNMVFCEDDISAVLDAAKEYVEAHPEDDYSVGGGIISGTTFGQSGNLNTEKLSDVINQVQDINSNLAKAKNTINLMQEAGIPLKSMVNPENLDFRSTLTDDVISNYEAISDGIGKLLLPAIASGGMNIQGESGGLVITMLTIGHRYTVTGANYEGRLTLEDEGAGTAGQITITYDQSMEDPAGIYTVVAKHVSSNWEITQTFSGDAEQEYKLVIGQGAFDDEHGANPSITGNLSLKDKNFTTPITFEGTVSATGSSDENYTSATFEGTLTTPHVTNTGSYSVNFPSSKPSGAAEWQKKYDFFTKAEMKDAETTIKLSNNKTIKLSGDFVVETQFIQASDYVEIEPKHIEFSGSYANTNTGLNFDGSATFNATWAYSNDRNDYVTNASSRLTGSLMKNGYQTYSLDISGSKTTSGATADISLGAGTNILSGHGSIDIDAGTGEAGQATLTLTSSIGPVLTLNRSAAGEYSGNIKVSGDDVATISDTGSMIRIDFSDNSFKEFPY